MNPLNFTGPEFLQFYLLLWIALGVVWFLNHRVVLGVNAPPSYIDLASLHAYEVAYLTGGRERALEAACAALIAANRLTIEARGLKAAPLSTVDGHNSLDRSILEACTASALEPNRLLSAPTGAFRASLLHLRQQLEVRGLLVPALTRLRSTRAFVGVSGLVLLLGLIKLGIGIARERPVGLLIVVLVIGTGLVFYLSAFGLPDVTHKGRWTLAALVANYGGLRHPVRALTVEETAIATGLFGIVAVFEQGHMIGSLFPSHVKPSKRHGVAIAGSACSSCGSASSCGSSGCGGGGCGGGGCGGCGS